MGRRSPDRYAVPLCRKHHGELHAGGNELSFFLRYALDPYVWVYNEYDRWKKLTKLPS
jgi:hypothetical protein